MFHADDETDTIVAHATASGPGERAVVRLAGPEAIAVAARSFEPADRLRAASGHAVIEGRAVVHGVPLDASAWVFRAPRSYTGEDLVELHVPSCMPLVEALLEALVAHGARPARPGEFTRRAFLRGRLDLCQAEAVQALATAASDAARREALTGLRGGLSRAVAALREDVLFALTHLEGALDFADDADLGPALLGDRRVVEHLDRAAEALARMRAAEGGRPSADGLARVVLYGSPNAGKSSLLNALAGREAALVSPTAGTTRDAVEAALDLGPDARALLCDVAGVDRMRARVSADAIDGRAEALAVEALASADLALVVLDGARGFDAAAREALDASYGRPRVMVVSKADLPEAHEASAALAALLDLANHPTSEPEPLAVSARTGEGLGPLRERLAAALATLANAPGAGASGLGANPRHRAALLLADTALARARAALAIPSAPELAAIDLREALDAIGAVTGHGSTAEDVLDRVFATFCLGK